MLVCPGCGGRNPPDLDVCAFCHRRVGARASGARPRLLVSILLTTLLLAVLVSVVLFVLVRRAAII